MNINSLNNLIKDPNQDELYNLFIQDFFNRDDIFLRTYIVPIEEEMRIDLVSRSIYGSVDYIDFLMNINDIDFPFNIKEGDIIYYCDETNIERYQIETNDGNIANNNNVIYTNSKSSVYKVDKNREKYIEKQKLLGPNFNNSGKQSLLLNNNGIRITKQ